MLKAIAEAMEVEKAEIDVEEKQNAEVDEVAEKQKIDAKLKLC